MVQFKSLKAASLAVICGLAPLLAVASPSQPGASSASPCEIFMAPQYAENGRLREFWTKKIEQIAQNIIHKKPEHRTEFLPDEPYADHMTDSEWQPVAHEVFRLLGDHQFMANFVRDILNESLEENLRSDDRLLLDSGLNLDIGQIVFARRAAKYGWKKIVWFGGAADKDFQEMLAGGNLFRDITFARPIFSVSNRLHGADGHLMQALAVAPEIDRIYGAGTMKKFLVYIGKSRKGRDIWKRIFDLGPNHYFNFHGSTAFYDFNILNVFFDAENAKPRVDDPIWQSERSSWSRRR